MEPDSGAPSSFLATAVLIASMIWALEAPANAIPVSFIAYGMSDRAAGGLRQMGLRFFGFQNSGLFSGPPNALPTRQTKPFLPWTAVSKFFCPSTKISASRDIDGGAAVRAIAISASRSIRYCSIGAMLGYGDVVSCAFVSCAWIGHAAPNTATNTMFPHPIASPVFLRIDCLPFDVNCGHDAPISGTSAACKWVLPNAKKVACRDLVDARQTLCLVNRRGNPCHASRGVSC